MSIKGVSCTSRVLLTRKGPAQLSIVVLSEDVRLLEMPEDRKNAQNAPWLLLYLAWRLGSNKDVSFEYEAHLGSRLGQRNRQF